MTAAPGDRRRGPFRESCYQKEHDILQDFRPAAVDDPGLPPTVSASRADWRRPP